MNAPRLTFCGGPLTAVPHLRLDAMDRKPMFEAMVEDELPGKKRQRTAWRPPSMSPSYQRDPALAFELTFVCGSPVLGNVRLGLAWARRDEADTIVYVKDRFLGDKHDPSLDVLTEFFADVYEVQGKGGTVVAHSLWWKSDVLGAQLRRFGLTALEGRLRAILARAGFCLMSPEIGAWLGTSPSSMADPCQELDYHL